jgi:LL-diaminopimelate aminotransferase
VTKINESYSKLTASYLFSEITKRVRAFATEHPDQEIIRLGIGDVTEPLPDACVQAFREAVDEMGVAATFRGYGPDYGYEFLRQPIAEHEFPSLGIEPDEIFVSDGAKCDTGNIQELFATDVRIAVPDPVYPVYVDTNVMAGRTGEQVDGRYSGLVYLESTERNGYVPEPPSEPVDLIYLCFPNNPTGATATREELTRWVDYARRSRALILFDAAYVAFVRDESLPKSIYEIEGAKEVAIEFRSFSKTAGFTGTRCAFTVIPKACVGYDSRGAERPIHALWARRQSTKFNGVSYPVQRAAAAVYTEAGAAQVRALSDYYLQNAGLIRERMTRLGYTCTGGDNSPYIWIKTNVDAWEFFDRLLLEAAVVCTPGDGFGTCGKGYARISAFNSHENVERAMERVALALGG